eukprot:220967_1
MKMLSCDDCKENILRKEMGKHISEYCAEFAIMCSFSKYGCKYRSKRILMDNHLKEKEIEHLKMKINAIENQLVENETTLKTQSEMLQAINNKNELLFLLKSTKAYIVDVESGKKETVKIVPPMIMGIIKYCMG